MNHSLPLLSALLDYKKEAVYPLHTPGHKGGRGALKELLELFQDALKIDVSLMSELDDIHNPQSFLLEAQKLAAKLYGAKKSFFSVNGTSGALHAMLLGALEPGEQILLPRNVHRSLVGGLIISGVQPIYIMPEFDLEFGIAKQICVEQIENYLYKYPDIKAVLLTSPDYYGVAADLLKIAEVVHNHGAVLLVDEAHGPHLGFSEELPKSALESGTDVCAQSTHKIVGALTQCSILHVQGDKVDIDKMQKAMSILTTTSPNYLLLASLDAACYQLAVNSSKMLSNAFKVAIALREEIEKMPYLQLFVRENLDVTKVTINVTKLGLTGFQVADFLRQEKIAVELADYFNILLLVTYSDDIYIIDKVIKSLEKLISLRKDDCKEVSFLQQPLTKVVLTPREAFYKKSIKVKLLEAKGFVAAQEITFYPPGVPLLLPGEEVTQEIIDYCLAYQKEAKQEYFDYIDVVLVDENR